MASTELSLQRTLTDVLEDELYHFNSKYGLESSLLKNSGKKNDLSRVDGTNFSEYQRSDSNGIQDDYFNDRIMFNKWADPSLTTMTTDGPASRQEPANVQQTPIATTVNLNNILKISNPFSHTPIQLQSQISNNNNHANKQNIRESLPYDVKISNDISQFNTELEDSIGLYDDVYNPKMYYPLEDSNAMINDIDAKALFDEEFKDDDDDDEEEDGEEENVFEDNHLLNDLLDKKPVNFVDSNFVDMATMNYSNEMSDVILNDDEDDDDDDNALIDEDQLYSSMFGKNISTKDNIIYEKDLKRSQSLSLVEKPTLVKLSSSNSSLMGSTPGSSSPASSSSSVTNSSYSHPHSHLHKKTYKRKPLTNINGNSTRHKHHNNTYSKRKEPKVDLESLSPSEIYTCRLVNLITKEPCSAQFSRSYDLTRHQNTIHAKRKTVFRCSECIRMLGDSGYDKTFSRLDALTRHIKSKHDGLTLEERQEVTKYAKENIGYVVG